VRILLPTLTTVSTKMANLWLSNSRWRTAWGWGYREEGPVTNGELTTQMSSSLTLITRLLSNGQSKQTIFRCLEAASIHTKVSIAIRKTSPQIAFTWTCSRLTGEVDPLVTSSAFTRTLNTGRRTSLPNGVSKPYPNEAMRQPAVCNQGLSF